MSTNQPESHPERESDTTVLHLKQFLPPPSQEDHGNNPDESVTSFIAQVAAETCAEKKVVVPKEAGPVPPASMLGIVSYCYVKGVYDSEEIERKMLQDPEFRAACQNEFPRSEDIRRFRRLNREAIQATLEKFFRRARKTITAMWWPDNPFRHRATAPAANPLAERNVTPVPEETQVFVRREASDRLEKATFIDGMSY